MRAFSIKETGPGPIISALYQQLGLRETINNTLIWDEKQCQLDPGTHVLALIINILCGRTPLYRVEEFFDEQDVELLFGTGVNNEHFNDDALGRTLDKIYAAGAKKVFSAVALQARIKENIDYRILHGDTTARLVYGAYPNEDGLNITKGYNREHRTDLKQYKIGLVATEEGFPLLGEILDGNLDDKTWNKQLLANLPDHFTVEELEKIIYVVDSAAVTQTNLELIQEHNLKFISRLPATFSLASELIEKAFASRGWTELGQVSPGKKKASYRVQVFTEDLYGREYRFVVVHSSHLDKRKLKGLQTRLKGQKEDLEKAARKIMGQTFACEADAKDALLRFQKEKGSRFYPLTGRVEKSQEKVKRRRRGRPSKGEKVEYREVYRIKIHVGELDEEAVQQETERLGCFVLITNLSDDYSAHFILKEYKEQTVVENRFKFVKHPLYVGPLYVQKKERLEALCYVILMALVVYIILQRRVRLALKKETEPLLLPGKKKSFEPTGNMILELFRPVKILYLIEDGVIKRYLPEQYNRLHRALQLIGFGMNIFVEPGAP